MSERRGSTWTSLPRRRPTLVLLVYWLLAVVATHTPPFRTHGPDEPPGLPWDKLFHFFGYATLAWLLMNALTRRRRLGVSLLLAIGCVAVYGVVDELTQPPFGRHADVWDYAADLLGLAFGLGAWMSGLRYRDTVRHA